MFTKGRPKSIVPLTLGDRRMLKNLSIIYKEAAARNRVELRNSRGARDAPDQQRPVSEVTEILSSESDSEFEEDSTEELVSVGWTSPFVTPRR
jgi:hypothetical protein